MFSISMTTGPGGRISAGIMMGGFFQRPAETKAGRSVSPRLLSPELLVCFLVDHNLSAVLQFPADRTIASGNNLVPGIEPAFDFHGSVIRDPSRDLRPDGFVADFLENTLLQLLALVFLGLLLLSLVSHLGA